MIGGDIGVLGLHGRILPAHAEHVPQNDERRRPNQNVTDTTHRRQPFENLRLCGPDRVGAASTRHGDQLRRVDASVRPRRQRSISAKTSGVSGPR